MGPLPLSPWQLVDLRGLTDVAQGRTDRRGANVPPTPLANRPPTRSRRTSALQEDRPLRSDPRNQSGLGSFTSKG